MRCCVVLVLTILCLASTTRAGGGCPENDCVYSHDDGVSENSIGLTDGGDMTWFNHFTTAGDCRVISTIRAAFGPLAVAGTPGRVLVYSDPNEDGTPGDALLLSPPTAIVSANEGTDVFNDYALDVPVTVGSSFFVAVQMVHADKDFPAAIDQTASVGESWLAFGYADPADPLGGGGTVGTADSFGFPGNLLVRACGDETDYALSCDGDTNDDTLVNVIDLVNVILCWGTDGEDCPRPGVDVDLNNDGIVDVQDLVSDESSVLLNWGPCPIVNDDREDAVLLPHEGTYRFHTFGATLDPQSSPYSCGDAANDVWFTYTVPGDGRVDIDTCGSDFDTVLEVLTPNPCPPDEPIFCNDDCVADFPGQLTCDGSLQSCLRLEVTAADVLVIRVGGSAGDAEGIGVLHIDYEFFSGGGGPHNAECGDAEPIAIGASAVGTTLHAFADPFVTGCTGLLACQTRGVWYSVVGDGTALTASLCGSPVPADTTITVLCGPCEDLGCLGFSEDGCGGPKGVAEFSWCTSPGQEYLVHVSANSAFVDFEIAVSSDGVQCGPADPCAAP